MKAIYVKYNRERLPEFQIETQISQDNGQKLVRKRALTVKARTHIKTIYANYLLLKAQYKNVYIASAILLKDEIQFEYITGNTYDKLLVDALLKKDKQKLFHLIKEFSSLLNNLEESGPQEFHSDHRFFEVFGVNVHLKNEMCLNVANIDMIFDNLVVDENGRVTVVDYEWVFEFKIPISFILFRSLYVFYLKYERYLKKMKLTFQEILNYVGIAEENQKVFLEMENNFQKYVYGKSAKYIVSEKYLKDVERLSDWERRLNLLESERVEKYMQLFWGLDGRFDEENSIRVPVNLEKEQDIYEIDLPKEAYGQLRYDPANFPVHAKIEYIHLYELEEDKTLKDIFQYDSYQGFGQLQVNNLEVLNNKSALEFFCMNSDPQILLGTVPKPKEKNLYKLRIKVLLNDNIEEFTTEIFNLFQSELKQQRGEFLRINEELKSARNELESVYRELQAKSEIFDKVQHELTLIKNSHGYKYLRAYYRSCDLIFPSNTLRRHMVKLIVATLRSPRKVLSLLTRHNIKVMLNHLKKGQFKMIALKAQRRINEKTVDEAVHNDTYGQLNSQSDFFINMLNGKNVEMHLNEQPVIDVIIPIYNALEYTKNCIDTVYRNSDMPFNLYLMNDKSPDPQVYEYLESLKTKDRPVNLQQLVIVHNEENLGFVQNVNKGFGLSKNHVILLNSDTEVPKKWMSRLVAPILLDKSIASVTPFSNSATICSFPDFCKDNDLPIGMNVDDLDQLFMKYGGLNPITLPTGVGFCMAINRHAINQVGVFDAELFDKGYGEENDWCMRAYKQGFKNVIAPNLFVYHKHGASFGERIDQKREERIAENLRKVEQRHPEYIPWVRAFIKDDPIKPIRDIVMSSVIAQRKPYKKGVLFINHSLGGGTKLYQDNYIKNIKDKERVYVLEISANDLFLYDLNSEQTLQYRLSLNELNDNTFKRILEWIKVDLIYINQLVTFPPYFMLDLIKNSNVPYLYFIHDFFCVCPSYNLINAKGKYCFAETNLETCQACISKNIVVESTLNLPLPVNVEEWREKFGSFLNSSYKVIAPSQDTKELVNKYYPTVEIDVQEHEILTPIKNTFDENLVKDKELTIAFIGAIGESKGSHIIYELWEEIKKQKLPISIKVIGITNLQHEYYVSEDGRFEITGRYNNEEISFLLKKHKVNIVVIPALWPETFSYTTSEAMLSGYPVITFNIGAPSERVKRIDGGWVLDEISSSSILGLLKELLEKPEIIIDKHLNIKSNLLDR